GGARTAAAGRSGPGPGRSRSPTAGRRRTEATTAPRSPTHGRPPPAPCAWALRLTGSVASPGSPVRPRRGAVRRLVPIDRPEASVPAVVRCRSAICLLGRFPALAGVDLDAAGGEIVLLSGA